jgi:hypothetical protein
VSVIAGYRAGKRDTATTQDFMAGERVLGAKANIAGLRIWPSADS